MSPLACGHLLDVGAALQLSLSQHVLSLDGMVCTAEQNINFFQWNILGLWYTEKHKYGKKDVDSGKEIECVESIVLQEGRKKLLEDRVGHVLGLRSHADCLSTNVHGENF